MKRIYAICCVLGVLMLVGCCGQETVIVQISDPQMGFYTENGDMSYEIANLSAAVNAMNSLKPDAVIFTGDLVHNYDDVEQWGEFMRLTSQLSRKIKVYYLAGNHDVAISNGSVDSRMFIERFGYDRFFDKVGCVGITGINSVLIKNETACLEKEEEQFEWLANSLNKCNSTVSLVFAHHPFFLGSIDEPDGYPVIIPEKRRRYFEIFAENGVKAVFAGHLHGNEQSQYGGVEMITTTAVGRQLGSAKSGVRIISVKGGEMKHKYYPLVEIPVSKAELMKRQYE